MKIKTSIFVVIFMVFSLTSYAQLYMKTAEADLVQILQKLRSPNVETTIENVAEKFQTTLKKLLKQEKSWSYKFPELRKYIDIKTSKDDLIRIFSWDSRMGGSWHDLRTLIQHQTTEGLRVSSFQDKKVEEDENIDEKEAYRDAAIINIYAFNKGYIFEGIGTHGSGNHHKVLMYYELVDDTLKRKEIFENNESIYVLLIPRKYDFDLQVNVDTKTITHSEYVLDDDIGFYLPTGKKVLLTFDGNTFKKQLKNKKP